MTASTTIPHLPPPREIAWTREGWTATQFDTLTAKGPVRCHGWAREHFVVHEVVTDVHVRGRTITVEENIILTSVIHRVTGTRIALCANLDVGAECAEIAGAFDAWGEITTIEPRSQTELRMWEDLMRLVYCAWGMAGIFQSIAIAEGRCVWCRPPSKPEEKTCTAN